MRAFNGMQIYRCPRNVGITTASFRRDLIERYDFDVAIVYFVIGICMPVRRKRGALWPGMITSFANGIFLTADQGRYNALSSPVCCMCLPHDSERSGKTSASCSHGPVHSPVALLSLIIHDGTVQSESRTKRSVVVLKSCRMFDR